ncbi:MAG: putative GTP-binding protein EngB [Gemmatimonadota bacterium]
MIIRSVEYAGTVAVPGQAPPGDLPQIAFSGRSNVGKSSLINTVLRRTRNKIAKVSATPGKTQALNFYRVNDRFFLVDLPGYGYARVPAGTRDAWRRLIDWYLGESGMVRGVVHLVDARRAPTEHDHAMVAYLAEVGVPSLIVLTKMDKLKASQRRKAMEQAMADLGLDQDQVVPFSSRSGEGRDQVLAALETLLAEADVPPSATDSGPLGGGT